MRVQWLRKAAARYDAYMKVMTHQLCQSQERAKIAPGFCQGCAETGPLNFPSEIQIEFLGKYNKNYNSLFKRKTKAMTNEILIVLWAKFNCLCGRNKQ